jgi:hypothetical protein
MMRVCSRSRSGEPSRTCLSRQTAIIPVPLGSRHLLSERMMMSARPWWFVRRSYLWVFLLSGLYLAALFLFAATWTRQPWSFSSDDLYCPSVCEDLLQGRDVQGWHVTAVPYVFPDLMLLLPCQALFSNLVIVFLAYDFLFYSLLTAAFAWVARLVGLGWRAAFLTACTGMIFFLVAHLDPAYAPMSSQTYQPGFHVGAILAGTLLMAIVLHGLRCGVSARTVTALLALCPLAVFSDRLLIVEFIVPTWAGLCLLAVTRAVPVGRPIVLSSVLGMGILLAGGIRWCFPRMGLILMCAEMGIAKPRWEYLLPFFEQIRAEIPNLFLLPLHLVAGLAVLLCWLRLRSVGGEGWVRGDRPAVLFVASVAILSPLSNLAAVFLHCCDSPLHRFEPPASRYLFACWVLPFLFLGLLVQMLPGWLGRAGGVCFRLGVVLFAVSRIVTHGAAMDYAHFEPPYPSLAQMLDRLERERGPMRGLAGFWTARRMSFLSHQRVWVRPASKDGSPFFHAFNPNRFLADDPADLTLPRYNFIIISPSDETNPRPREVLAEFGEPIRKIAVAGGDEVWLYHRLSSPRFDHFLEAQLAPRLCRREKYVAPVSPSVLGIPKPNFKHWWSARNVQLEQGEDVEIRFDRPTRGGLIDVAANYDDEYRLAFYRGEELLGTLNVPAVPWTGAVPYWYPPPDIQSRLLRVPESLRHRAWDRVVVRSAGSSTRQSLGHFLVFEEDVTQRSSLRVSSGWETRSAKLSSKLEIDERLAAVRRQHQGDHQHHRVTGAQQRRR